MMRSPCTAMKSSPRLPQLEKARAQQRRSNAAKKKINKFIKKKKKSLPMAVSEGQPARRACVQADWMERR